MSETQDHSGSRTSALPTFAALAAGMIVFGSATPVSKLVTGELPVFVGAALRVGIGALALLPFVLKDGTGWRALDRRDLMMIGLVALFGMVGFSAFMLYGMTMASGVAGSIVMSTTLTVRRPTPPRRAPVFRYPSPPAPCGRSCR